jgi:TatD DNase family protein
VTAHQYVEIGINLTDPVYSGFYHGKNHHEADIPELISRATEIGCTKLLVTASDLRESEKAIELAEKYPGTCFATVGVHPCQAERFEKYSQGAAAYLSALRKLAEQGKAAGTVKAFGEIGLDYDRFKFASKETQLKTFEQQLDLAIDLQLPLFLHMRAAAEDFVRLIEAKLPGLPNGGVVHSFTGTKEELNILLGLGLHIGINGCSLKTEENLGVVKEIPLDRLHLETDGPWCEIRASHASSKYLTDFPSVEGLGSSRKAVKKERFEKGCIVKTRTEPCAIERVAWVVAKVKGIPIEEVTKAAWHNSTAMFGL